jgi:Flp pilus assembly protein TadG
MIASKRASRRGLAAAELALLGPLLVLMILGAVDFGRFAYNYIAVINAARAGASYGIMNNFTSSTSTTWSNAVKQAAKDELTTQIGSSNLSNVTVTVTTSTDTNNLKRVQVKVSYPFTTIVNWSWTGLGLPHTVTMQHQVDMRLIR